MSNNIDTPNPMLSDPAPCAVCTYNTPAGTHPLPLRTDSNSVRSALGSSIDDTDQCCVLMFFVMGPESRRYFAGEVAKLNDLASKGDLVAADRCRLIMRKLADDRRLSWDEPLAGA